MAMERPRPDVVEDDQDDQQDQRRDPRRMEQVREVVLVERTRTGSPRERASRSDLVCRCAFGGSGSMPCQAVYSAGACGAGATVCRRRAVHSAALSTRPRGDGRMPGCEPCCRSRTETGSSSLARDLLDLGVEIFATDGTREYLAGDGVEVASVSELTQVPPLVGGQVKTFHPRGLRRHPRPPRRPRAARGARGAGDRAHRPRRRQRQAVRPGRSGPSCVGIDEAIEMIDVGGAALLGAAARNAAGVAAVADPAHYPLIIAELRERGLVSAERGPSSRPRRSAPSPPITPRSPPT